MRQGYHFPVEPLPYKKSKIVTVLWKPVVWINRDKAGNLYFSTGENNIHYNQTWLWKLKNRIKNKLFHKAKKRIDLKICRWYIDKFHSKPILGF